MSLEAFGVSYASLKFHEWVVIGVGVATFAVVSWEEWDARKGGNHPALKVTAGMMLSFLGGMAVEGGIGHLRSGTMNYGWLFQVFMGVVCVLLAIHNTLRRKAPMNLIEWLNEHAKPR